MKAKHLKIYKKLFINYLLAIIFLIITLDGYFIKKFLNNNMEKNLYINDKVVYDINEELNQVNNSSDKIIKNMYNDLAVLEDILVFMSMDNISYLMAKLDKFSESDKYYYNGIERFVARSFLSHDNLEEISFTSYDRLTKDSFNRNNQIKTENIKSKSLLLNEGFNNIRTGHNSIEFIWEIRNPIDLKPHGIIALKYNLNNTKNIYRKYEGRHEILIIDSSDYIIYSVDDQYEYEEYKYADEVLHADRMIKLDANYYMSKIVSPLGITSISIIPKREVYKMPLGLLGSIILVDILVFAISISIVYVRLMFLNRRTNQIILAMDEVKKGNLDVEIPLTDDNDEINYISENFNNMCKNLDEYIKRSYLSQIEQKKAEMIALQNQINPHFLYNTLESIRMKAISNGDREVGKMLYILSFLFRKQLKDESIISLKDELYYCEQYIEIFKFRYEDNFTYQMDCPDQLGECKIPKFSIQPMIENYFVHGIRLEDFDNTLKINVSKVEKDVIIKIIDNGRGIEPEELEVINNHLLLGEKLGDSLGITNVNDRLINEYGEEYGVKIENNKGQGITVTIRILCRGV